MGLWKKYFRKPPAVSKAENGPLDDLAADGVEVVIFVSKSNSGKPCFEAMQLEGGRIPTKLAEPTPLQDCDNTDGCNCGYERYIEPPRSCRRL